MRNYPVDEYDKKDLEKLNAEKWMVELLKKNPNYCSWGNYEDYMSDKNGQWNSPIELESVNDLWELDDLNELVNFYFDISRDSVECEDCGGSGLNKETKKLSDGWYSFDETEWIYTSSNRRYNNNTWQYHLTEAEIKELVKRGRLNDLMKKRCNYDEETGKWFEWVNKEKQETSEPEYPTPEQVNEWARVGMGHDGINQWICVESRAKQLGVYGHCDKCEGEGRIFTEPKAKLSLQMWFIHPRKGSSRGVYLKNIEKDEVETVIKYLKEARDRNADRFSKL